MNVNKIIKTLCWEINSNGNSNIVFVSKHFLENIFVLIEQQKSEIQQLKSVYKKKKEINEKEGE